MTNDPFYDPGVVGHIKSCRPFLLKWGKIAYMFPPSYCHNHPIKSALYFLSFKGYPRKPIRGHLRGHYTRGHFSFCALDNKIIDLCNECFLAATQAIGLDQILTSEKVDDYS